ncbi:MAG: hypothetical protein GVY33_13940 [Alphaproteobacteria bacterium]|nr:hypothetical protein [Alphaproteobacteria bacterium]
MTTSRDDDVDVLIETLVEARPSRPRAGARRATLWRAPGLVVLTAPRSAARARGVEPGPDAPADAAP